MLTQPRASSQLLLPSQWGDTHSSYWSLLLHSPKNYHFSSFGYIYSDAIFMIMNQALQRWGDGNGWVWTKVIQQRLQESKMGLGTSPRQGWNPSLAGRQSSQQLGPFLQHLCWGHRAGSSCTGGRRLACLQLMEVAPDVRAPWGGICCAMTPESPLWPQICWSNYKSLIYTICGSVPTYLTSSKTVSLCAAGNKSDYYPCLSQSELKQGWWGIFQLSGCFCALVNKCQV